MAERRAEKLRKRVQANALHRMNMVSGDFQPSLPVETKDASAISNDSLSSLSESLPKHTTALSAGPPASAIAASDQTPHADATAPKPSLPGQTSQPSVESSLQATASARTKFRHWFVVVLGQFIDTAAFLSDLDLSSSAGMIMTLQSCGLFKLTGLSVCRSCIALILPQSSQQTWSRVSEAFVLLGYHPSSCGSFPWNLHSLFPALLLR